MNEIRIHMVYFKSACTGIICLLIWSSMVQLGTTILLRHAWSRVLEGCCCYQAGGRRYVSARRIRLTATKQAKPYSSRKRTIFDFLAHVRRFSHQEIKVLTRSSASTPAMPKCLPHLLRGKAPSFSNPSPHLSVPFHGSI